MKKKRFYVNGEFWTSLEVSEQEMRQGYKEYGVATMSPAVPQSTDDIVPEMCRMKRVCFKLTRADLFAIYDDELYIEDGYLYLR